MANFTTLTLDCNTGNQTTPTWTATANEVRWSDVSTQDNVASASWPAMIRPAATGGVNYTYCFTADATGTGLIGSAGAPLTWAYTNFKWARWDWDNLGTFASAPIFTAYPTTAHGAITPGDGSLLGGHATDTGSYSYLKGNAYGRVESAGAPAAAPGADAAVGDGSAGSVSPTAGANWLANFQSLQGDTDYITFPATPAATTADKWWVMFRLFTGPNMTPATYTVVMSLKYTWT